MKMARASQEEIDAMLAFHHGLDELADHRRYGHRSDAKTIGQYVLDNLDKLSGANRVVFGFQVVQQVLDMNESCLALKPEYNQAVEAVKRVRALVEGNLALDFTGGQIVDALDGKCKKCGGDPDNCENNDGHGCDCSQAANGGGN